MLDKRGTINFTNLAEGTYYYNVIITDLANDRNNTEQRPITFSILERETGIPQGAIVGAGETVAGAVALAPPENISNLTIFEAPSFIKEMAQYQRNLIYLVAAIIIIVGVYFKGAGMKDDYNREIYKK